MVPTTYRHDWRGLTQRALDWRVRAAFLAVCLAEVNSVTMALSRPTRQQVTHAVRRQSSCTLAGFDPTRKYSRNVRHDQLDSGKYIPPIERIERVGHIVLIIAYAVGLVGCLYVGMIVAGGIILGSGMASGEAVLHSDPNPDNSITIHVISDDCGATCDCTTRLDMEFGQEYQTEIYRINDCDVEIKWLDRYRFEVIDIDGNKILLDARDFGNVP